MAVEGRSDTGRAGGRIRYDGRDLAQELELRDVLVARRVRTSYFLTRDREHPKPASRVAFRLSRAACR